MTDLTKLSNEELLGLLGVVPAQSDAGEAAASTARETGPWESLMIGAGRTVDQIGAGIKQAGQVTKRLAKGGLGSPRSPQERAAATEQTDESRIYEALQRENPAATGLGEALPYVAVPASLGVLKAAGMVGAIEATKYGTPEERAQRGAIGAVATGAGGIAGNAIGRAISPVSGRMSTSMRDALQTAEAIGVRPRLSQVTGSPTIGRIEDYAARAPGGSGVMANFEQANAQAINRTGASAIGENADEITAAVLARARGRIGKVFDDIKALPGKQIGVSQDVGTAADDILRQQSKMIPAQRDPALVDLATQAKTMAVSRGRMDGETYQLIRSGLSEASFDASGTNKTLYGKLLKALDDSAEQSLQANGNTELAAALRTARPQYASLITLEKGMTVQGGNISPAKVASTLRTNNPAAFREGRMANTPLGKIAEVGENVKPLTAGSPTAPREQVSNPLSMVANALWSTPLAKITTSPLTTWYPRKVGGTAGARGAAQLARPAGREAVAVELQRLGLLPTVPVVAE